MFAALSEKIEAVRSRLKKFIALGPLVSLKNEKSPLFSLIASEKISDLLFRFGVNEVLWDNWFTSSIAVLACRIANFLCQGGLFILSDMKPNLDNLDRMDVIMGHYPSGTSMRDYDHFVQMVQNDDFQKYDFRNETENLRRYGQKTPPVLNLSNVDAEVHLYVGRFDELADLQDFEILIGKLNGTKKISVTEIEGGHATFLWGKNMTFLEQILQQIRDD
jgi:gastric triacylglycerol lipase